MRLGGATPTPPAPPASREQGRQCPGAMLGVQGQVEEIRVEAIERVFVFDEGGVGGCGPAGRLTRVVQVGAEPQAPGGGEELLADVAPGAGDGDGAQWCLHDAAQVDSGMYSK